MAAFRGFARLAPAVAAGALLLGGCGEAGGGGADGGAAAAGDETATADEAARLAALSQRLDALEAEIVAAEDVSAIKRLTRTYSYYLDRGLWADLTELMTEDARGSYPAGVFIGKDSLAPHFLLNNGRGYIGFEAGRLGNHIALQPIVTLNGDGTANGRWRVLAQLGQYGQSANWAGGVYENQYRKEDGVWKISGLRYYGGFSGPYETGWAATPTDAPRPGAATFRNLPHPADEPAETDCQGYPTGICIPPFHFANPGSGRPWAGLAAPASAPVAAPVGATAAETADE